MVKGNFVMKMFMPLFFSVFWLFLMTLLIGFTRFPVGEPAYLRAILRPNDWEPAGNGTVVKVIPANEAFRKNGFPYGDEGSVIICEIELPGNQKKRFLEPFVMKDRICKEGEEIPVVRYKRAPDCYRVDLPGLAKFERRRIFTLFVSTGVLFGIFILFFVYMLYLRSWTVKALSRFHVHKFKVRPTEKEGVKLLEPLDADLRPFRFRKRFRDNVVVTLFLDPEKPEKSLVAESLFVPIAYDPEKNEIIGDTRMPWLLIFPTATTIVLAAVTICTVLRDICF